MEDELVTILVCVGHVLVDEGIDPESTKSAIIATINDWRDRHFGVEDNAETMRVWRRIAASGTLSVDYPNDR